MQVDSTTYRSPNHSERRQPISALVLHHGAGTRQSDLAWLCNPASKVSAHYYVCRDGTIYQLVDDSRVAWHAGASQFDGRTDVNAFSLGIETEHTTDPKAGPLHADWPPVQLDALAWLCRQKMAQYAIPPDRVVSHRAVATPPGRKDDPAHAPLGPEPNFRAWVERTLAPAPVSTCAHGIVLTSAPDVSRAWASMEAGGYATLKVVSGWGLDWQYPRRHEAAALAETLIVRTVAGDPSAGKPYPHSEDVLEEIRPWYAVRPRLWVELGNEPNSHPDVDPAGYAWHLNRAIERLRAAYPRARLIAPALGLGDPTSARRWMRVPEFAQAIQRCDAVGVHQYAHHSLDADDTGQAALARELLAGVTIPWALTEYGIHDPATSPVVKGERYARFVRGLPAQVILATAYHLCTWATDPDQAAYATTLAGDAAYGARL